MKLMWINCEINMPDISFNKRDLKETLTNRCERQIQSKYLLEQTKILI